MPTHILSPEYRDELRDTNYPFGDNATLQTLDGFSLTPGTFLDASVYPIGAVAGVYLSSVSVTGTNVTVTIGDDVEPIRASATFDPVASPLSLTFTDSLDRPAGMLLVDPTLIAELRGWGEGIHLFEREATEFVPSCVIPTPELGLRGLVAPDGTTVSGDVWLVGEDGVSLTWDCDEEAIRVDITGDPLFIRRLCDDASKFETPRFLKEIVLIGPNGLVDHVLPDERGNIFITAGDGGVVRTILRIAPTDDGSLKISVVGKTLAGGE